MSEELTARARSVLAGAPSPEATQREISEAVERAVRYLVSHQEADGCWREWPLEGGTLVGEAWPTAFIGLAVAAAEDELDIPATGASRRGADWLEANRSPFGGWNWGGSEMPPDVEGTALSLALLQACGRPVRPADILFILRHWRGDGFATFDSGSALGMPRHELAGAVHDGLPPRVRAAIGPLMAQGLLRDVDEHGTWPLYWWASRHFGAWGGWKLLLAQGACRAAPVPYVDDGEHATPTVWDFACLTGRAAVADPALARSLAGVLISLQHDDGGWAGGRNIAFPKTAERLADLPLGADIGVATTAACARALVDVCAAELLR